MESTRAPAQVPELFQFRSVHGGTVLADAGSEPGSEQRHAPRLDVALEVSHDSDSNFYLGLTENISEGGVFIATVHIKPVGSRLHLDIALDDGLEPLRITGEVRWSRECSPHGIGVRFLDLSKTDKLRIRAFLVRRDPLFFEE
jgi:uncharacterized protein (TIGR02266 family)